MQQHSKPVLYYIPFDLLDQIEDAATQLGLSKSEVVRRCIRRELEFVQKHEIHSTENFYQTLRRENEEWRLNQSDPKLNGGKQ